MKQNWTFALPPAVGDEEERAGQVRSALAAIGCRTVRTALTYGTLMDDLVSGHLDAAWAPPLVCARMETLGSRILLRAVRGGAATYRSVMFGRAEKGITLETLDGKQAAWLDQRSMSGYVLPRALLRKMGKDPDAVFNRQKFLGSFAACVQAVLDGKVDISSTFATSASCAVQRYGFTDLAGPRVSELAVVGYSDECPNDGILVSPRMPQELAAQFADAFQRVLNDFPAATSLATALEVDGFEVPPQNSYQLLREEVLASPP